MFVIMAENYHFFLLELNRNYKIDLNYKYQLNFYIFFLFLLLYLKQKKNNRKFYLTFDFRRILRKLKYYSLELKIYEL